MRVFRRQGEVGVFVFTCNAEEVAGSSPASFRGVVRLSRLEISPRGCSFTNSLSHFPGAAPNHRSLPDEVAAAEDHGGER